MEQGGRGMTEGEIGKEGKETEQERRYTMKEEKDGNMRTGMEGTSKCARRELLKRVLMDS
jgi:hypothetical protein